MTWTLNASGHCASEEDERALVQELNKVLSGHKAGTSGSGFTGQYHVGPAHGLSEERKSAAKSKAADS
jgi:hypothetical protein